MALYGPKLTQAAAIVQIQFNSYVGFDARVCDCKLASFMVYDGFSIFGLN